jgi:hypothetical protein
VKNWEPPADLMRLLEALANDVVAASDAEVAGSVTTGVSSRKALALPIRMRGLIEDAIEEPGEARDRPLLPELDAAGEVRQRPH